MATSTPQDLHVLWHCAQLASSEHARVQLRAASMSVEGVAVLAMDGEPCDLTYHVDAAPLTVSCLVDVRTPTGSRRVELSSRGGEWTLDGAPAPQLAGCTEVDLGWTPATNTSAMRRLALEVGDAGTIRVALVRFPELDVEVAEQRYTRLAEDRWAFDAGDFHAEIATDPATAIVRAYGEDLWRAVGWTAVDVEEEIPALDEP